MDTKHNVNKSIGIGLGSRSISIGMEVGPGDASIAMCTAMRHGLDSASFIIPENGKLDYINGTAIIIVKRKNGKTYSYKAQKK